jgi:hypothetical protein
VLEEPEENIRLYETLFSFDSDVTDVKSGSKPRSVIASDKRIYLCEENHRAWALEDYKTRWFTLIGKEVKKNLLSIVRCFESCLDNVKESKHQKITGIFSLMFGARTGFSDKLLERRKWFFLYV